MIHYIKGKVTIKAEGFVVIENNGMGYEINVPATSQAYLVSSAEILMMYTAMIVREDDMSLYGFTDTVSLEIFRKLMTVSGVGAKAALAVLSALTTDEIRKAVVFNDPDMLTRAQGIGKKTAQRIALELKDKLEAMGGFDLPMVAKGGSASEMKGINEAIEALVSLGYTKSEAAEAIAMTGLSESSAEEYIKAALKGLSRL